MTTRINVRKDDYDRTEIIEGGTKPVSSDLYVADRNYGTSLIHMRRYSVSGTDLSGYTHDYEEELPPEGLETKIRGYKVSIRRLD